MTYTHYLPVLLNVLPDRVRAPGTLLHLPPEGLDVVAVLGQGVADRLLVGKRGFRMFFF